MDGFANSNYARDPERSSRRSLSHYPRAPSRSSTSTSSTRMTPHSANSSSSRLATEPPPRPASAAHPSHRYHHNASVKPPITPRPQSVVPRMTQEPQGQSQSQSAVSSFLQERLQKTREEAERNAIARLRQDMAASMEERSRTAQTSPAQPGSSSDGRASTLGSSTTAAEPPKKKGMGVKEMEATVSTLHKQNFDLKLELFHRRERQNALEERVESLEANKRQMEDVNDRLLEELEKRDKAVQEAVQMIILLEAQVEQLLKEREMVRQVEAAGYIHLEGLDPTPGAPTSAENPGDLLRLREELKAVNRMPSFLSDNTENTANLRHVLLGTQAGLLSSPKMLADGVGVSDIEMARYSGAMSPSLSVLSESSFVSIYGDKGSRDKPRSPLDEPLPIDGNNNIHFSPDDRGSTPRPSAATPHRGPSSGSASRTSSGGRFQSINDVIERSPLQRIERLDRSLQGEPTSTSPSKQQRVSQSQTKSKMEKREALRRVHTDTPPSGHRQSDQGLPPTPDTISTSTLRRFETSNSTDTLAQSGTFGERSNGSISDSRPPTDSVGRKHEVQTPEDNDGVSVSRPQPKVIAPTKRRSFVGGSYFDDRMLRSHARPRSADETTASFGGKGNAWDSDSDSDDDHDDDDDGASIQSLESSLDIWLQQGKETKRRGGRGSPDLFGFPASAAGWKTRAMVGPGPSSSEGPGTDGAPLVWPDPLEDLVPIQQALFGPGVAPPPPNRRSSLHARTGSASAAATTTKQGQAENAENAGATGNADANASASANSNTNTNTNSKLRNSFIRAVRRNSDDGRNRPARLSLPQQKTTTTATATTDAKQGNNRAYPPLSRPTTSTSTPRTSRRINSLWRRSLGGTGSAPSPTQPSPATEKVAAADPPTTTTTVDEADDGHGHVTCGTPSWIHRSKVMMDDDTRALGATPPPIQRQPQPQRRRGSSVVESEGAPVVDGGSSLQMQMPLPTTPVTPVAMAPNTPGKNQGSWGGDATPTAGVVEGAMEGGASLHGGGRDHNGSRRKWIPGFGRASGLRNRMG
ncbi:hypothetical protein SODALDRAFT_339934 [Sodiomyces alkalinus F11]|uniref:Centrosomin N-terminal motif 1 domain-containing protein n=1 Tax=Sodiomyces alkalinus (strain CBS 110278 / VKM F-3762 / F11) TaxID=1314773 RepID=A0A3N2PVR1_SODAK|nr:hypothetical protein SODALDRAFT_339934 [Sodiomyces alkalinus F11]ROT38579.1 hypothetical protein SODALDRAFT_339934 [Sodiomyces alkalinus F11]